MHLAKILALDVSDDMKREAVRAKSAKELETEFYSLSWSKMQTMALLFPVRFPKKCNRENILTASMAIQKQLSTVPTVWTRDELHALTFNALRRQAKRHGIKGRSREDLTNSLAGKTVK